MELYVRAEKLYIAEQNNLGLANTLTGKAAVLIETDRLSEALELLAQARELYRSESMADWVQLVDEMIAQIRSEPQ